MPDTGHSGGWVARGGAEAMAVFQDSFRGWPAKYRSQPANPSKNLRARVARGHHFRIIVIKGIDAPGSEE
jgi:hypothetical protein